MILMVGAVDVARGGDALEERMETHWRLAASLQAEVVRGNLPVVRDLASRLARLPPDEGSAELRAPLERLHARAEVLARAGTVGEATTALAALGAACADCHASTGGGPSVRPRAFPPADCAEEAGMVCHQWAADWLWLGLVAPSASAWDRGARELAALAPDPGLRDLAARAVGLDATAGRERAYAELVSGCAGCHVARGSTP